MPRIVEVDFTDAPPAQGGAGGDHIPPGKYLLEVKNVAQEAARSSGRPMFTAIFTVKGGAEGTTGKSIRDNFVLPQTTSDSKFGLQRFHAFLLALGLNVSKPNIKFDLDRLTGLTCIAEVYDDTLEARDGNRERVVTKVGSYFPVPASNGTSAAPSQPQATEAIALGAATTPEATIGGTAAAEEDMDDLFAS